MPEVKDTAGHFGDYEANLFKPKLNPQNISVPITGVGADQVKLLNFNSFLCMS
jgi:hypothetical protein